MHTRHLGHTLYAMSDRKLRLAIVHYLLALELVCVFVELHGRGALNECVGNGTFARARRSQQHHERLAWLDPEALRLSRFNALAHIKQSLIDLVLFLQHNVRLDIYKFTLIALREQNTAGLWAHLLFRDCTALFLQLLHV